MSVVWILLGPYVWACLKCISGRKGMADALHSYKPLELGEGEPNLPKKPQ